MDQASCRTSQNRPHILETESRRRRPRRGRASPTPLCPPAPPLPLTVDPARRDATGDRGRAPLDPRTACAGGSGVGKPGPASSAAEMPLPPLPSRLLLLLPSPLWSGVERAVGSMCSEMPAAVVESPLHGRWLFIATLTKAACCGSGEGHSDTVKEK
jgi:hypothetical protein